MRFAIDTLHKLPPPAAGEDRDLAAFRAELREELRARWEIFIPYFDPDSPKGERNPKVLRERARFFAREFLRPAQDLYAQAPCAEYRRALRRRGARPSGRGGAGEGRRGRAGLERAAPQPRRAARRAGRVFRPGAGGWRAPRPRRRTRRRPSRATARRSCGRCAPCSWTCAAAWSGATRRRTASSTRKTPCAGWTCSPPGACPSARNGRRRAPCCARPPRTRRTSPGSRGSTRSTARRKRPASASCARWRGSCPRPRRARTRR